MTKNEKKVYEPIFRTKKGSILGAHIENEIIVSTKIIKGDKDDIDQALAIDRASANWQDRNIATMVTVIMATTLED